ncbi:MFS transporter [Phytohabitans sp. ZYX-F-186]|uniref:MFS transporter n=1 Tax=Phytohabitans maris TaxID=3071409 RepID=A0ABU0ZQU8_9ACTN|nr:MFS transporter [Phytohabitans sp. ZYX-F-186]MDQ7909338.1 MFS transporter [Phytohabitans sp. ZYX-F-186]
MVVPPPTRQSTGVVFAILTTGVAAYTLLQAFVMPVLAQIQHAYDTDQATVTWVLTAYLLSASVATPLAGRVGDAIGKKRALVWTLGALAAGSLFAAVAPSIEWLIAARVVQGLGGGVLPLAFGLIRDVFPADRIHRAISVIAALGAVGFGAGVVVAGPLVDLLDHHWLFWIPMAATAVAGAGTIAFVPESRHLSPGRINPLPALTFGAALIALLLAISQAERLGWGSWPVVGLLCAAPVLAAVWAFSETRVRVPFIDMNMMAVRGVWASNLVAFLSGTAMYAGFGFLPQLLQTPAATGYGLGATVTESGLLMLPSALFAFVSGLLTPPLIRAFSARAVIASGCLLNAVSFLMIATLHDAQWQIYVATTLWGFGQGLMFSSLASVVTASVRASQSGVANGMNANIRTIGGAIGAAGAAAVVTAHVGGGGFPEESGYVTAFLVAAGILVVATLAALAIPPIGAAMLDEALEFAAANAEIGMIPGAEVSTAAPPPSRDGPAPAR